MERVDAEKFELDCYDCGNFCSTTAGHLYKDYCDKKKIFLHTIGNNTQAIIDVVDYPKYILTTHCHQFKFTQKITRKIISHFPGKRRSAWRIASVVSTQARSRQLVTVRNKTTESTTQQSRAGSAQITNQRRNKGVISVLIVNIGLALGVVLLAITLHQLWGMHKDSQEWKEFDKEMDEWIEEWARGEH